MKVVTVYPVDPELSVFFGHPLQKKACHVRLLAC